MFLTPALGSCAIKMTVGWCRDIYCRGLMRSSDEKVLVLQKRVSRGKGFTAWRSSSRRIMCGNRFEQSTTLIWTAGGPAVRQKPKGCCITSRPSHPFNTPALELLNVVISRKSSLASFLSLHYFLCLSDMRKNIRIFEHLSTQVAIFWPFYCSQFYSYRLVQFSDQIMVKKLSPRFLKKQKH